jgi:ADP-ribose pyrophosphatase YjhB (NUDIX family)
MPEIKTERTLCFLVQDSKILLSIKKLRQGVGNYNGYGGGVEDGETIEDTAVREIKEESCAQVEKNALDKRAIIEFYFPNKAEWNQRVHVYFVRSWKGEPSGTEEMAKPVWFDMDKLPSNMWDSDKYWLPYLMDGKKIRATFYWKEDNKTVETYKIDEVNSLI